MRSKLYSEAKAFLTYNGKLNARVKREVREDYLHRAKKIYPLCGSFKEAVYCVLNKLENSSILCPKCQNDKKRFHSFSSGYYKTCGKKECVTAGRICWCKGLTKETDERLAKQAKTLTKIKKGKEQSEAQKNHLQDMIKGNIGKKRDAEIFEKAKITQIKKYGVKNVLCFKENQEKAKKALFNKYGGYYPESKEFQENKEAIFDKMRETNKEKYGAEYATQNPEVKTKIFKTKRKRGNLKGSGTEDQLFEKLKSRFSVIRNYTDIRYPFACDFYFPDFDFFVELHAHWTHGGKSFNPESEEDKKRVKEWREKNNEYFENAISTWTIRDLEKFKISENNNLNILFVYENDYNVAYRKINSYIFDNFYKHKYTLPHRELKTDYSDDILQSELHYIKNLFTQDQLKDSYYSPSCLIEKFQSEFYSKENELWQDSGIRESLVSNRVFYLGKSPEDLTDRQLLKGFKISGIYSGYSHFSIIPMIKFIHDYNIKSIYDPCGGWGHRYLGALAIDYAYADNNKNRYGGVKKLHSFTKANNGAKRFYLWDSTENTPDFIYDCVFTCPPYYDLEDFGGVPKYKDWLNLWWRNLIGMSIKNCMKYFVFVINHTYKEDMLSICLSENLRLISSDPIVSLKNHFQKTSNKAEFLCVLSK